MTTEIMAQDLGQANSSAFYPISQADRAQPSSPLHFMQQIIGNIQMLQRDLDVAQQELKEKDRIIEDLRRQSPIDPATGLLNKTGFLKALEQEITKTNRNLTKGGLLIMIDLDNLQTIYSDFGARAATDAVILFSQTLNAFIRRMDVAARVSEDEFILMFSNANPIETSSRVQKLARKLNTLAINADGERISLRASIGIETYKKGDSMEQIINRAGHDLKKNKKGFHHI